MKKLGIIALTLLLALSASMAAAEGVELKPGGFTYAFTCGDAVLVTAKADFPIVTGLADEAAMLAINGTIRETIEREFAYDELCNYATVDHLVSARDFSEYPYFTNVTVQTAKRTAGLLSLCFLFEGDFGGAHGDYWECVEYFDLSNGAVVPLGDMVTDPEAFRAFLVDEVLAQITAGELDTKNDYFGDYENHVREWTLDDGILAEEGLVVYFYQTTIGPYSSGPQYFTVPYDKLAGYWNDTGKALLEL